MLYVNVGVEEYTKKLKTDMILERIPVEGRFYFGDDSEISDVIQALHSVSFFSPTTAVVLSLSKLVLNESTIKEALGVADDQNVILVISAIYADKRNAAYKNLKQYITEYPKLADNTVIGFLSKGAEAEGVRITQKACESVIERSEYRTNDEVTLFTLRTILKQLALFGDISEDIVRKVLPDTPAERAYLLAGDLLKGNYEKVISEARKMLKNGESEIGLLSLILKVFRTAWKEKAFGSGASGCETFVFRNAMLLSEEKLSKSIDCISKWIEIAKFSKVRSFELCMTELATII